MTNIDYQARQRGLLETAGYDVVALVPGANLIYFTGLHYHLSERPIIAFITTEGLSVIVPTLEASKLHPRSDLNAVAFAWNDSEGYRQSFEQAVSVLGLDQRPFGIDGQAMRVFEWLALQEAGANMTQAYNSGQTLLQIRARKTDSEISALQRAIDLSEKALKETLANVSIGMTERDIAKQLSDALNRHGSEGNAFGPIVLTGEKSALPHGNPDDRVLQDGEFLLIDFGGIKDGYPADITRTFVFGTPSDEMSAIYDAVYRANAAARAIAAPGISCHAVDEAARRVIEEAGYGDYFTHRTGHGLGLEIHELPQIASGVHDELAEGMVFTIEPGIYIDGLGGVRIEDNILITADGARSLTSYPREI